MEGQQVDTTAGHVARLFAMSPDLLAAAGFDGLLKEFNDAWEQQLGHPREVLAAMPYLEHVHPEDLEATKAAIGRLAQGEHVREHLCRLVLADGTVRWYSWSGGPGEDTFYIVGRDVQVRQQALADTREFAATASHDLSEPLRTLAGYLDLLERRHGDALGDEGRALLATARGSATRMRRLIDGLLAHSRVTGAAAIRVPVDLAEVADEVLADLDTASGTVTLGPLPTVPGDPVQLHQLLANLLANALKFRAGDRPATVEVTAARDDGGWLVSVVDDGPGIPEHQRERVFTMLTRLHGDDVSGTGMGLAICRRVVERHGGRIWVEGAPGGGSAFRVLLPDVPPAT